METKRQSKISVIIPTMNRVESLKRTFSFLENSSTLPNQVIVVDQTQKSDIANEIKELCRKTPLNAEYKWNSEPSSTKARNSGYVLATNELLVFMDDDVDVAEDTLTNVSTIMEDNSITMIAGIDELTAHSRTNIGYLLGTKSFKNRKIGHVTYSMLSRYPDDIKSQTNTQWAQGFFFVVRKSCMDKWQIRWDENLTSYAYAEDLDFSYSYYKCAVKEGLRCILDPSVHVKHLATLEYRVPSAKSTYMYIVNRKYLAHKHNMGFKGAICRNWCELWRFLQYVITRRNPGVFFRAYLCKFKYAKEINAGNLDYEKFMKW